ncbi:MAG: hypothetical protein ACFFEE_09060, partial [Candidatus Thorarchaeota archaeon]
MESLGTITMCFPHVDEETRSVLKATMEKADNFANFTERLFNLVMSESTSALLSYLTVFFLNGARNYTLLNRLEQSGKIPTLAEPLILCMKSERGHDVSWVEMRTSLLNAINEVPNDWFATQLYLTWRMRVEYIYTETDVDVKPIDIITSNVNSNEELEYFRSHL